MCTMCVFCFFAVNEKIPRNFNWTLEILQTIKLINY